MVEYALCSIVCFTLAADPLGPGDNSRTLQVDGLCRSFLVHLPPSHDPREPTAVVLVFHRAGTNGRNMVCFSGMSDRADEARFIVVYPNGTGLGKRLLTWNSGGFLGPRACQRPDDVRFVERLLDELGSLVNVDPKRVYATGHSNGAMMCYRLAAGLSDRIGAIAPVSGTMAIAYASPRRPAPVLHFHGTADMPVKPEG